MQDQKKDIIRYSAFWLWLLAVTLGVWVAYDSILKALPDLLGSLLRIDQVVSSVAANTTALWVLQQVLFVLLWWRAIKVFVLHGSPFTLGMEISEGKEDGGQSGRMVWRISIGDQNVYAGEYDGRFWYGAVFRAHPSSDKLVRSRLGLLVLALPLGYTLHVQESRVFIRKDGHESRARVYRLVADRYAKIQEHTTPDRFRSEVVRQLRSIGQYFDNKKRVKRIDGLDWHFMGRTGRILDDFGHRVSFEYLEEEKKYKATELGPNGKDEKVVESISELRDLVKADFQSTWSGKGINRR